MGMNTLPQYEADDGPLSPAQIKQLTDKLDMNERIEQFAAQAEEWVSKNYPDAMDDYDEFHAQTMSKFAELIVKECLVAINQSNGVGDDDVIKISQDVKKHFGVE
jgi:hypothetical protein